MIGDKFIATGVSVKPNRDGKYWANLIFQDAGFCQDNTTEGTLTTRYAQELGSALDVIIADARRLGVVFWDQPAVYMYQDGEDKTIAYPADWRAQLQAQCNRLGWKFLYTV